VPYDVLGRRLQEATAGIHTMRDEHFGISNVEFMAAGVVAIAHDSAGPREDIVVPFHGVPTGFRATTALDYAEALAKVFSRAFRESGEMQTMRHAAREHVVASFSDKAFDDAFLALVNRLLSRCQILKPPVNLSLGEKPKVPTKIT